MTNLPPTPPPAANSLRGAQLSVVGVGVMAEAMIAGLLRRQLVTRAQIVGSHPRPARRDELQNQYGVRMVESNAEAARQTDTAAASVVVVAVKPQRVGRVLQEVKESLAPEQLLLSVVAGTRLETIPAELGHNGVLRSEANTPAQIGQGMTAWTATPEVSERQLEAVRALLGALGREMYVENENMIDMATALSATGPTYIFMMM